MHKRTNNKQKRSWVYDPSPHQNSHNTATSTSSRAKSSNKTNTTRNNENTTTATATTITTSTATATATCDAKQPQQIPGYVFDPETKRYFKISKYLPAHLQQQAQATKKSPHGAKDKLKKEEPPTKKRKQCPVAQYLVHREIGSYSKAHHMWSIFGQMITQTLTICHNNSTPIVDIAVDHNKTLMTGSAHGELNIYEMNELVPKQALRKDLSVHGPISSVKWGVGRAKGMGCVSQLGSGSSTGRAFLFNNRDPHSVDFSESIPKILGNGSLWTVEWHPSGDCLALAASKQGFLWNVVTNKDYYLWTNKSDVMALNFSQNGNIFFIGTRDGVIRTLDMRQSAIVNLEAQRGGSHYTYLRHKSSVCCMKSLMNDNYLLSSSIDATICMWDRRTLKVVAEYPHHVNSTSLLKFTTDSNESLLFAGGQDKCVRIWDIKTTKLLKTLGPFADPVQSIAYSETWYTPKGEHAEDESAATRVGNADPHARAEDSRETRRTRMYRPGIWLANGKNLEFFSMGSFDIQNT